MSSFRNVRHSLTSNRLWKAGGALAGVAALIGTSTASDVQYAQSTGGWASYNSTQKLQYVFGKFISRITNGSYTPWSWTGTSKPDWNIANALNGVTIGGLLGVAYSKLSVHYKLRLPFARQVGMVALPVAVGSFVGGLLDDAVSTGFSGVAPATPNAYPGITSGQSSTVAGWSK